MAPFPVTDVYQSGRGARFHITIGSTVTGVGEDDPDERQDVVVLLD